MQFIAHIVAVVGVTSSPDGQEFRHLNLFPVAQDALSQQWSGWHEGRAACRLAGPFYGPTPEIACRRARKAENMEKARENALKWAPQLTYLELEAPDKLGEIIYRDETAEKEKKEKKEAESKYRDLDLSAIKF